MKVIRNNYLPIAGFNAINLFGVLFVRGNARINDLTFRHEEIHTYQMKEMLYIGFYIWYAIEWLIRLLSYSLRHILRKMRDKLILWNPHLAYRKISFEKEAYGNQTDLNYEKNRKLFSWFKYI